MSYKLRREVVDGKVVSVSLGAPEVDAYLKFLKYRCRLNTWISYGYDLQIFLNSIKKLLTEVTPANILAFIESQQGAPNRLGRTNDYIEDKEFCKSFKDEDISAVLKSRTNYPIMFVILKRALADNLFKLFC